MSANQNNSVSQFELGLIYLRDKKNKTKGVDLILQSAKNNYYEACFYAGCFYHQGKCVDKNIIKAISNYKESSNKDDCYARNNLGIIYKNGFGDEVKPNVGLAIA